ncbi:MAG: UTP--glucose-1-phosphate uridylyltransferase GalU [Patescibacteria group bacterium]|jgi:UTP--glucose-1-phosphate uridylyltransferase|nr:UTP--glucose-1-phosphate uridylyltransferase GalU [Patescibacteria group bacterium]HCI03781.1 UTP--glucose-1-phosphate uridylyltransferase [Candidatus Peribacteria bacterium]|tara:strand:+ start:149 stop:1024 length:876 start_codon:yes stop_codon:yes gene_type:complete
MSKQTIKKVIIPVAGFGTRFLPATKAQPKEMLTLVDKPVIQYIVEEAVESGITEIILVTGQNKRAIEDHFDRNFELEYRLKQKKKKSELEEIDRISNMAKFYYVRQQTPLGDGHAILQAINLVGKDEPVAVLFGDDIVVGKSPALKQLMDVYEQNLAPVIAAERVDKKEVNKYGIIDINGGKDKTNKVTELVEKPDIKNAPSNLAVIGKYIVTPEVLQALVKVKPDKGGEIRLIDALKSVLATQDVYSHEYEGTRYDCGSKLGFLKATIHFGLQHKELKRDFAKYLKSIKI